MLRQALVMVLLRLIMQLEPKDMEGVAPWRFVTKCLRTFAALQP